MRDGLRHYATKRESPRLLPFWSGRLADEQLEANQSEILTRADCLIDGLEMLCPRHTEGQQKLVREAVVWVKKAVMVAHGALVTEQNRQ